jgi:hypothetical protein
MSHARFKRRAKIALAATLLMWLALSAKPAQAAETYYLAIFASDREPVALPEFAHTFGTFARVTDQGPPGLPGLRIDTFTISWMPRALAIRLARLLPECGANLDLPTTLQWARQNNLCVSMWGPYQIDRGLYERALAQKAYLESGAVRYKAIDTGYPASEVSNCIHAMSDIAFDAPRLRVGTLSWGNAASYFVALSLYPEMINPRQTHDWLLGPMGLSCQPLVRRDLDRSPTKRPVLHVAQSLAHWEITRNPQRP